MSTQQLPLAILMCCVGVAAASAQPVPDANQRFFVAPVSGVNGSGFEALCAAFLPPAENQLHIRCSSIRGGRAASLVQLTEGDLVFGERIVAELPAGGGATFTSDIASPSGRITSDLVTGKMGIQFGTSAGPEGFGRFAPADETRTVFNLAPIQGNQDGRAWCEMSTIPEPPGVGVFCGHNMSPPFDVIVHEGTLQSRGQERFRIPIGEPAGDDQLSALYAGDGSLVNALNTTPINLHIVAGGDWIGGDNLPCRGGSSTLCLNDDRFKVEVDWRNSDGQSGDGTVANLSDESGLFFFSDPNNWEMLVKVLDNCSTTNQYWVFAAATTDVGFDLTVTDTQTGATKMYNNPLGTRALAITDTSAFATCP